LESYVGATMKRLSFRISSRSAAELILEIPL
jgi:hypothetical protein